MPFPLRRYRHGYPHVVPCTRVIELECTCVNHKQMWNAAKIATYESDLVKFIRSACGEQGRADRAALITLTTLARKADYRTVNLAKNFVKMVLKGYKMNEAAATGTCSWELPLIGINNMLCGAQWDLLDGPQDLAILDYMQAQWKAIARAVRRDLPILRSSEPHSDHARKTVITTLAMIGITKSNIIRDQLCDAKTSDLYLTCWAHMSVWDRRGTNDIITALYFEVYYSSPLLPRRVVDVIGFDTLLKHYKEWLSNHTLLHEDLLSELDCLKVLVLHPKGYIHAIAESPLDQYVVSALKRQSAAKWEDGKFDILDRGLYIVTNIGDCTCHTVARIERLLYVGVLPFAVEAMLLRLESSASTIYDPCLDPKYGYQAFLELIERIASGAAGHHRTAVFMGVLQEQVERLHIPTHRRLAFYRAEGGELATSGHEVWRNIAARVGVTERSVREKWRARMECYNPFCKDREVKIKVEKKELCERCQKVRYCSVDCLQMDLQEHKSECR